MPQAQRRSPGHKDSCAGGWRERRQGLRTAVLSTRLLCGLYSTVLAYPRLYLSQMSCARFGITIRTCLPRRPCGRRRQKTSHWKSWALPSRARRTWPFKRGWDVPATSLAEVARTGTGGRRSLMCRNPTSGCQGLCHTFITTFKGMGQIITSDGVITETGGGRPTRPTTDRPPSADLVVRVGAVARVLGVGQQGNHCPGEPKVSQN
jgi:hypothetical protein